MRLRRRLRTFATNVARRHTTRSVELFVYGYDATLRLNMFPLVPYLSYFSIDIRMFTMSVLFIVPIQFYDHLDGVL